MSSDARKSLLKIYHAALAAVDGRRNVCDWLLSHPLESSVYVVAIGKAAAAMFAGVHDACPTTITRGLIITKEGHAADFSEESLEKPLFQHYGFPLTVLESAHPVPDQRSLDAGQALLSFIEDSPVDAQLLFLISGGSSSLVELLPSDISLDDLKQLNSWLLASGLNINEMNQCRMMLSCIKGGRLLSYLGVRKTSALYLSDVPNDDPSVIGSGLLAGHSDTLEMDLPEWLQALHRKAALSSKTILTDRSFAEQVAQNSVILVNNKTAREAAAVAAQFELKHLQGDFQIIAIDKILAGDVFELAAMIVSNVEKAAPGLYIYGGEPSVKLPANVGQGGRCQSLALAVAIAIAGMEGVFLLAAGTDGSDGAADIAGALVDNETLQRVNKKGFDALECLQQADAGSCLEASGDLLFTGPSGSNVMDLVLALKLPK